MVLLNTGGFMNRFACALGIMIAAGSAWGGQVANVNFIHSQIKDIWGLDVPYNQKLANPNVVSNMEYLLSAIDRANFLMNGEETSSYRKDEKFATRQAVDVLAAAQAVRTLIRPEGLIFRTVPETKTFAISLALAGEFRIAWGDGTVQNVSSSTTDVVTYTHTYEKPGVYYVAPYGVPTAYNQSADVPTIEVVDPDKLSRIYGTLGSVFPTLADGSQPSFNGFCAKWEGQVYKSCSNLEGSIPADFFTGIHGAPRANMFKEMFAGAAKLEGELPMNLFADIVGPTQDGIFDQTFNGCQKLTGTLSAELFAGVTGEITERLFKETFRNCDGITGPIPADLFAGVYGAPKHQCFRGTFEYMDNISGKIPEDLFARVSGAPAIDMFANTFKYCVRLEGGIPEGLFSGIEGAPAIGMFYATFQYTRSMSGQIPQNLFKLISGAPAANMFADTFSQTGLGGELTAELFAGLKGAPAEGMFMGTFYDSGVTKISPDLFKGVRGEPRRNMFNKTFHWTDRLGEIPGKLFDGFSGPMEYEAMVQNEDGEWVTEIRRATGAFANTFSSSQLKSIPEDLMGNTVFGTDDINGIFSNMFAGSGDRPSKLTGPSLKMFYQLEDGTISTERKPIYEIWVPTYDQNTYSGATGLEDYDVIPANWK